MASDATGIMVVSLYGAYWHNNNRGGISCTNTSHNGLNAYTATAIDMHTETTGSRGWLSYGALRSGATISGLYNLNVINGLGNLSYMFATCGNRII